MVHGNSMKESEHTETAASTSHSADDAIMERWRSYTGLPWEAIGAAMDLLLDLTSFIRNSGASVRSSKMVSHFVRPDDAYFEEYCRILIRTRFPAARSSLVNQLAYSVFDRRRYILYRIRHRQKLSRPRVDPKATVPQPSPTPLWDGQSRETHTHKEYQQLRHALLPPVRASEGTLSDTEVRTMDRPRPMLPVVHRMALSGITEGSASREEAQFKYPKPPVLPAGTEVFVCPYCGIILKAETAQAEHWRFEDSCPCIRNSPLTRI